MWLYLPQFMELPVRRTYIVRQGMRGGQHHHSVGVVGIKRVCTLGIEDGLGVISEFELSSAGEVEPVWQHRVAGTQPRSVENVLEPFVGSPQQHEGVAELGIGRRVTGIKLD